MNIELAPWLVVLICVAACFTCCIASCCIHSCCWRRRTIAKMNAAAEVIQTSRGPVEYCKKGKAPYMLCINGTPTLHDGVVGCFDQFLDEGFGVLTVSRCGYGRTPKVKDYEECADVYAALLDILGIEKVVVHTISGGGPAGYNLAIRHPEKVVCLIPECSVSGNLKHKGTPGCYAWYARWGATNVQLYQLL